MTSRPCMKSVATAVGRQWLALATVVAIGLAVPSRGSSVAIASPAGTTTVGHRLFVLGATDPVGGYRLPDGVAVDERDGTVYVVDTANHRVTAQTPRGEVRATFGGRGQGAGQLVEPKGIAVAPDGTIYVADAGNHRIQRFAPDGRVLAIWGRVGIGDGEFGGLYGGGGPVDVAVGPDGMVFAADLHGRLQTFTPDGMFLGAWDSLRCDRPMPVGDASTEGLELGRVHGSSVPVAAFRTLTTWRTSNQPLATAADGSVFVGSLSGIFHFSANGRCLGEFSGEGEALGRLGGPGPSGLAVAPNGDVFVADVGNGRVQRFGPDGAFRGLWYLSGGQLRDLAFGIDGTLYVTQGQRLVRISQDGHELEHWGRADDLPFDADAPRGVAVQADGTIWVSSGDRIQHYTADGAYLGTVGAPGSAPGRLAGARGLEVTPTGRVFVAEMANHRVQVLDDAGRSEVSWGGEGDAGGEFRGPADVTILRSNPLTDWLVVPEAGNHRISFFHQSGSWFGEMGSHGSAPERFDTPMGIATTNEGFWVADSGNDRLVYYDPFTATRFVGTSGTGSGNLDRPHDVVVGPAAELVVADTGNHRVQIFDDAGRSVALWGGFGHEPGRLIAPEGVALSPTGDVYVADSGNLRVQRFRPEGAFLGAWPTLGWARDVMAGGPRGASIDVAAAPDGRVFVADYVRGTILRYGADGQFEAAWAVVDPQLGRSGPEAVAVTPTGQVVVLGNLGVVYVYSALGDLVDRWPIQGDQDRRSVDVAVDPLGGVYVLFYHYSNPRVRRYRIDGTRVADWPLTGGDPGDMRPLRVEVGPDGTVYTLDDSGRSVERHDPNGLLLSRWSTGGEPLKSYPHGLAVGPDGRVFVSRNDLPELQIYGPDGTPRGALITSGACDGRIAELDPKPMFPAFDRRRLAMRSDGTLLVAWRSACVEAYLTGSVTSPLWRVERYANAYLAESPVDVSSVPAVDLDWGRDLQHPRVPPQGFTARLEKRFTVEESTRLDLDVAARGGLRLWVDNALLTDAWGSSSVTASLHVMLASGEHRILAHHRDAVGDAALRLDDRLELPADPVGATRTPVSIWPTPISTSTPFPTPATATITITATSRATPTILRSPAQHAYLPLIGQQ